MNTFQNDNIFFINNYIVQYKPSFIRIINKNTNEIFQSYLKYDIFPFLGYRNKPANLYNIDSKSHIYIDYYNYYCNNQHELEETMEIIFNDIDSIKILEYTNNIFIHFYSICDYDFYITLNKILFY